MENSNPNNYINGLKVQHVAKPSSDQLLSKFAEVGSDRSISAKKELRLAKRIKRSQTTMTSTYKKYGAKSASASASANADSSGNSLLAPAQVPPCCKSVSLVRRLGITKAKLRAKELNNKSIISAIQKTWRTTVEGASRVLMEKHYNRHKRLINDLY